MQRHIIIADDEAIITSIVRHKLGGAGMCVHTFDNGLMAWNYLKSHPIDLLITDYQMPGLAGDELCLRIRAKPELKELPIIMLTGKLHELSRDFLKMGCFQALVTKPFSPNALLKQAELLLQASAETSAMVSAELH